MFIVVLEYSGAVLLAGAAASRVPVCEHAYDLGTGMLAGHRAGDVPRVGFPVCQRGWNTPAQAARCPDCDVAVQRAVRDLITAAVGAITSHRSPPGPGPPAPESTGSS